MPLSTFGFWTAAETIKKHFEDVTMGTGRFPVLLEIIKTLVKKKWLQVFLFFFCSFIVLFGFNFSSSC